MSIICGIGFIFALNYCVILTANTGDQGVNIHSEEFVDGYIIRNRTEINVPCFKNSKRGNTLSSRTTYYWGKCSSCMLLCAIDVWKGLKIYMQRRSNERNGSRGDIVDPVIILSDQQNAYFCNNSRTADDSEYKRVPQGHSYEPFGR